MQQLPHEIYLLQQIQKNTHACRSLLAMLCLLQVPLVLVLLLLLS